MTIALARKPDAPTRATERGTAHRFALLAMAAAFATQAFVRPTGPANSSPVDVFTLTSIMAAGVWASCTAARVRAPYLPAIAVMVLGGALAGAAGPLPGAAVLAVVQDLVLVTWCAAVTTVAWTPRHAAVLSATWAYSAMLGAAALVFGALAHITAITGVVAREGNRALFTFGDPNYAATYWVLSIFIVHASLRPRRPVLRVLAYVLLVWALLLTESNGGVVELALGLFVLALFAARRRAGPAGVIALLLVVLGVGVTAATIVPLSSVQTWARDSNQPLLVNSIGRSNESSAQRGQLVSEALDLYRRDGWQGSGPASTKPLLSSRSYPYAKEAHDDFVAALVERGPIGLVGLLLLVAAVAVRARRVARAALTGPPTDALPRPAGLLAALAAVAAAATYYEVLHFRFVWALFGLVAAVAGAGVASARRGGDRP